MTRRSLWSQLFEPESSALLVVSSEELSLREVTITTPPINSAAHHQNRRQHEDDAEHATGVELRIRRLRVREVRHRQTRRSAVEPSIPPRLRRGPAVGPCGSAPVGRGSRPSARIGSGEVRCHESIASPYDRAGTGVHMNPVL